MITHGSKCTALYQYSRKLCSWKALEYIKTYKSQTYLYTLVDFKYGTLLNAM